MEGEMKGGSLGLMVLSTVTSAARDLRARAQEDHVHEVTAIERRIAALGLEGVLDVLKVDHALGPVPDKAYLECISKLPRPGEHLRSRPGVVRSASSRPAASKRKMSKKISSK